MEIVAVKKRFGDPEERAHYSPTAAILLVEELRRMMPEITGDPDLPIERVVQKRKFQD